MLNQIPVQEMEFCALFLDAEPLVGTREHKINQLFALLQIGSRINGDLGNCSLKFGFARDQLCGCIPSWLGTRAILGDEFQGGACLETNHFNFSILGCIDQDDFIFGKAVAFNEAAHFIERFGQ